MIDEKTTVNVKAEEGRELTIETADGKERTYYRDPIRTMHLTVTDLKVTKSFVWSRTYEPDDDASGPPALSPVVSGTAALDGFRTISVIGEPDNRSSSFSIGFARRNPGKSAEHENPSPAIGEGPLSASVWIGFLRANWEIGIEDSWFVDCKLTPETLTELVSEVMQGRVKSLRVGLQLRNIYTDDDYAPPSVSANWFLRPDKNDNTTAFPQVATGQVTSFVMELGLPQQAAEIANGDESDEAEEVGSSVDHGSGAIGAQTEAYRVREQAAQAVVGIQALTLAVQRLNQSVRWIGSAIALILLVFLMK
ncbi:MAG: hypothetical protein EPN70_22495 [Paraburkholderia sp.]|uniref:hypothetical protein n=1 Tax=Paraburkholderia sp. TaxID=1926495 RepID=UPI001224AB5E|nr:hypothetical protein [Paraburkholderia sp.]TAM00334.1 MAG: hypothetical protein EPN70_22495 [Paraburkholderia sp.]